MKALIFEISRHKCKRSIVLLALLCPILLFASIPPRPTDRKIVHDYANVINEIEENRMEDTLKRFAEQTGNEVAVVTVDDLDGMDKAQYAAELGQKWGVGGKKNDNGIVILIKPKTSSSRGQAFIATGYGLEGVLPDALCSDIVNNEMIPRFKENDYAGGIWDALQVILPIARGEYSEQQYYDDVSTDDIVSTIITLLLIAIFVYFALHSSSGGKGGSRTYTGGPIIFGNVGSSSWGSSSHSSGGWGGFSGGSFGGGGGGGSW